MKRKGKCTAVGLYDFTFVSEMLEISSYGIIRNVYLFAEFCRQHLVVEIHLVQDEGVPFHFKHLVNFLLTKTKIKNAKTAKLIVQECGKPANSRNDQHILLAVFRLFIVIHD